METTQIPEVREPQRDHILCFHFSAPSILSCVLCRLPRCTNHPKWLGCVRMFQLARRLLHQYKRLRSFPILARRSSCVALTKPCLFLSWLRETCKRAAFENRLKTAFPRSRASHSVPGSTFLQARLGSPNTGPEVLSQSTCLRFLSNNTLGSTLGAAFACLQHRYSHSYTHVGFSFRTGSLWLPDSPYRLSGYAHQQ